MPRCLDVTLMPIPSPGPEYWSFQFGITTFDQFKAATSQYLDLGLPHIDWIDTPLQKTAYLAPASVTGVYLTAALTAASFHESSPGGPATATSNSQIPLFNSAVSQELAMPSLVIPDCFQVTISMAAGGHAIENVIGVENSAGTAAAAATAVKTAWEIATGPLSLLSNAVAMTNYHAVDISSSTGTIADLASTTAGGAGSTSLSTRGACALIKWNGANRSRSTRGRLYYGPIGEAMINSDGATVASGSATSINTAFTAFRTSLAGSGYPLVVLSRTLSQAFAVTAQAVESTIATQRRRIRN